MAYEGGLQLIPGIIAGADLSAKQFTVVSQHTTDKQVVSPADGTVRPVGILQNKPTSGLAAAVARAGVSKFLAGASGCTAGVALMAIADGTGKLIPATTGKYSIGMVIEAADSGNIGTMLIQPCLLP